MKVHTSDFKSQLTELGRELRGVITYGNTTLEDEINSITPHYEADILKSVMKQLDLELTVDIPLNTVINCQIGILVNGDYEMLNYGNYVVYNSEKQEDTNTYKITCYDKLLYSMKQNEDLGVTYPISIKNYLNAVASKIGLSVASGTFYNQDLQIPSELYLGLEYTYRDILDEIAQATGSIICLNENDEILVKYPTITGDTIDEEYLKDINVDFGQKYGVINSIVLSRSGESDNVYLRDEQSVEENGLTEVKIVDNQIMNFNNRSDYLQGLLAALDGLYYYLNDFNSTGILYYEVGDLYNVQIGENTYQCLMLNDEINVTTGIEEIIHTDMPEKSETDYSKADKTDMRINKTYLIVDKQNQTIESVVNNVTSQNNKISRITQTVDELNSKIQDITDITKAEESSNAVVNLTEINESEPIMLKVRPITKNISKLYPKGNLYPSNNQYLDTRIVNFKRTYTEEGVTKTEDIPYELPDDLLYYDSNNYDEFYLDYDSQTCQITKRCEWFGGSGRNLFNPDFMKNSIDRTNIASIEVGQLEKYKIKSSATGYNRIGNVANFYFGSEITNYTLLFDNMTNLSPSDIYVTKKYYDLSGNLIDSMTTNSPLIQFDRDDMGTRATRVLLDFEFADRITDEEYSFNVMVNLGTVPAVFETHYVTVKPLAQEQVIDYPYPSILLKDGDYEISLVGYDIGYLFVRLMAQNIYTTQFVTNAKLTSEIDQTARGLRIYVGEELSNYTTTNDMNTLIDVTARGIKTEVSETYATKDTTNSLSSRIKQTAKSIELTTTDNGTSAGITIRVRNEDGTQIDSDSGNITLSGKVAFTNLTDGTTTISGSNIKTGTIDASKVNVTNLNASNITSGTISGSKIKGGTIDGDDVTIKNLDASKITSGTISGTKISGGTINGNDVNITNLNASNIKSGSLSATRISGGTLNGDNMTVKNLSADSITTGTLNGVKLKNNSISGASISGGSLSNTPLSYSGSSSDTVSISSSTSGTIEGYYGSKTSSNRRYALKAFTSGGRFQSFNSSGGQASYFDHQGAHTVSDIRLKNNITNIEQEKSLNIINNLTPIEFTYKADETEYHRGLSAQEVEQVLKSNGIEKEIYEIRENGDYSLNYSELIPDLINCIKYLTKEIEKLKGGK